MHSPQGIRRQVVIDHLFYPHVREIVPKNRDATTRFYYNISNPTIPPCIEPPLCKALMMFTTRFWGITAVLLWALLRDMHKSLPYELPKILEAAAAILTHYIRDGERLLNSSPRTFTRCQESVLHRSDEHPTVVGDFGSSGLDVNYFLYEAREYGVACFRKFP